jgi:hypothetical protein
MIDSATGNRHALCEQYQSLYEQTWRIEQDARRQCLPPAQVDPHYLHLCHELEAVTLQIARLGSKPFAEQAQP